MNRRNFLKASAVVTGGLASGISIPKIIEECDGGFIVPFEIQEYIWKSVLDTYADTFSSIILTGSPTQEPTGFISS